LLAGQHLLVLSEGIFAKWEHYSRQVSSGCIISNGFYSFAHNTPWKGFFRFNSPCIYDATQHHTPEGTTVPLSSQESHIQPKTCYDRSKAGIWEFGLGDLLLLQYRFQIHAQLLVLSNEALASEPHATAERKCHS
jgi:hypothetical protein